MFDNVTVKVKQDGTIDILFAQLTQEGEYSEADVVAGVRIVSKAQWREIKKLVDEQITTAENAEK